MKKFIYIALFPVFAWAQNQNTDIKIETPVKAVTLYLEGAQINQQKQISLNAGITQVVFTNLSSKLIPKSIQVNVGEGIDILSINEKLNYLNPNAESPRSKALTDSLKTYQYKEQVCISDKDAFEKEKDLLIRNTSIGGQDKGVSIAELKLAADFYRVRVKEINLEILKLNTRIEELNLVTGRIENELNELNTSDVKPSADIIIQLQADAKTTTTIDLKYVVTDAGWAPYYDLKADDVGKPITLVYKARAFNNTGVNWANVKLKLSTSDPTRSASKPELSPWFLNFQSNQMAYVNDGAWGNAQSNQAPQKLQADNNNLENSFGVDFEKMDAADKRKASKIREESMRDSKKIKYEEVQVSELSAEFDIKKTYSIPADAKPYIIEVTTYSLNASFKYYSVPKIERDAFLLARVVGWEDLDLIEGPANVYFGDGFVGQSYINPNSVNDTLELSFGRDNKVVLTRTKIKDFDKEKVAGNNRKMVYSYEIVIKNNRKNAITIDVEDQLPVSQNSEIIVEPIELSKGLQNKDDGKVSWTFLIPSGESQKVLISYSIKYPRNRTLNGGKKQVRMRAKF